MRPTDKNKSIPALILGLIILLFIAGVLRAFSPARAAATAAVSPTPGSTGLPPTVSPVSSEIPTGTGTTTPLPTLAVTDTPVPVLVSADTTGIIALAIVVVVITLVGLAWGARGYPAKKSPKK